MTDVTSTRQFKKLARKLHAAGTARGLRFHHGGAEAALAQRIRDVAAILGISEHEAMQMGFPEDDVTFLTDLLIAQYARLDAVYTNTSPILLPIAHAARILAACGQAALLANLNRTTNPPQAAATVEHAAAATTTIAVAVERVGTNTAAIIDAAAVVQARFAMTTLAENLTSGTWTCTGGTDHEQRTRTQHIAETLTRDLQLLPPQPSPDHA